MNSIVCIKQVPYIDQLKFDPVAKRVIRDGVESEINPFDRRAITKAIDLRQQFGGSVVVVTMGPRAEKSVTIWFSAANILPTRKQRRSLQCSLNFSICLKPAALRN
jgi:Electron transfer flavoprotein domain